MKKLAPTNGRWRILPYCRVAGGHNTPGQGFGGGGASALLQGLFFGRPSSSLRQGRIDERAGGGAERRLQPRPPFLSHPWPQPLPHTAGDPQAGHAAGDRGMASSALIRFTRTGDRARQPQSPYRPPRSAAASSRTLEAGGSDQRPQPLAFLDRLHRPVPGREVAVRGALRSPGG